MSKLHNTVEFKIEYVKELLDRTRTIKVGLSLDRNSEDILVKKIREVPGFSKLVSGITPIFTFEVVVNLEATSDRKFKADLKSALSRIKNFVLKVI